MPAGDVATLGDYLSTFRRRWFLLAAVAFFTILTFVALALTLPPTYYSSGTILIEQQDVPEELVRSTVTTYADERIQIVSQRVMTRGTLSEIIKKYDLYEDEREAGESISELIYTFRDDTSLGTVSANISNPRGGRSISSTIAFKVGYEAPDPNIAKEVATELADLYLSENARSRAQAASETSEFLDKRSEMLDAELDQLERDIATFKEAHGESLPELLRLNTDRLEVTDREIDRLEREIRSLKDNRDLLQSELAIMSPFASYSSSGEASLTAPQRLDALQREYITLSSKYGPKHPDLIRVRTEIELLTGGEVRDQLSAIEEQLFDLRIAVESSKARYSSDHPEVVALLRQIDELEDRRAAVLVASSEQLEPTNPLFIQKQGALTATQNELTTAQVQLTELMAKRDSYEDRLTRSPEVEREYTALMREYDSKRAQFREIQDKQETARLAESLETEQKGERFTLIDPPRVPKEPVSPNRLAIIVFGLVLAAGLGMGLAAIADAVDSTVRGTRDVMELFGTAPIASIGYIRTQEDTVRTRNQALLSAAAAAGGIAGVVIIIQVFGPAV